MTLDRHHRWDTVSEHPRVRSFCGIVAELEDVTRFYGTRACLECDEVAGFVTLWRRFRNWVRRKRGLEAA